MKDWCLQHPWMTFFILVTLAESIGTIGKRIVINRKLACPGVPVIQIANVSGDPDGICLYAIEINRRTVCTFNHYRPHGLSTLLRRAAEAIDKCNTYPAAE